LRQGCAHNLRLQKLNNGQATFKKHIRIKLNYGGVSKKYRLGSPLWILLGYYQKFAISFNRCCHMGIMTQPFYFCNSKNQNGI
jgi:hypothetical protein